MDFVRIHQSSSAASSIEIDAVVLAGRDRAAIAVGEAGWARTVDGSRDRADLEQRVRALPSARADLRFEVAARDAVTREGVPGITAGDIFATAGERLDRVG